MPSPSTTEDHPQIERRIQRIGFVGLGRMGQPMSRNLMRAGFTLKVFDTLDEKIAALVAEGAQAARSPADAAAGADLVISMILDDAVLETVALAPDGILQGARAGTLYADMSTVSPIASAKVAQAADRAGVAYLRAKVSGSIKPATEGTLTIFASGPRDAYDQCQKVFSALGRQSYYVGSAEEAIYLKLVHSLMVGLTASLVGEALTFGERGGVDWKQMIEVLNHSALSSPLFNYKTPLLQARDYTAPQSTVDVAAKDIDLALAAAKALNIPLPLAAVTRELFRSMQARGEGGLDFIGIVKLFETLAGVDLA
jgi:3-hydroxyisobutyrate dehydrogenase-like beta-hydroxyacid dehydrogenase